MYDLGIKPPIPTNLFCGEIYHGGEGTRSLLEQTEQAATRGVELDVRRYATA